MVTYTKIDDATLATSPVADDAVLPADVSGADNKIEVGQIRRSEIRDVTSSGAQSGAGTSYLHIVLNNATAINYTITGAPVAGDTLTVYIETTAAHTLLLSGSVTFDGTNATMTYSTAGESLLMVARSATRWDIIHNNGGVLSA